ncbi:MAG: bifunctional folylpolyglutamate synthase/dihydrofolate synthase [Pseudomonadales bacterium]|nr:bifunctional folylpolyglutamate synthase/dihydrofolate synthase [Pseudomonadales bacterium]
MLQKNLADWLAELETRHSQLTGKSIDLGLDRVRAVADAMGLLSLKTKPNCQIVTVAGTNGKGSFVSAAAHLLSQRGFAVASYTSPHMHSFNERIQINQSPLSDQSLAAAFEAVEEVRSSLAISLSYFEFTTLAALYCFKQTELDVILLEVGLGGRLDAVNIIDADIAVITSIGLDHQDFLGDNLETIALEKCGILRDQASRVVLDDQPLAALQQAVDHPLAKSIDRDFVISQSLKDEQICWQLSDRELAIDYPAVMDNGLSISSQAGAIVVVNQLLQKAHQAMLSPSEVESLADLTLAGRFQQLTIDGVSYVFDVAHNLDAVALLQRRLQQRKLAAGAKRIALFAMLSDKPLSASIACLKDTFFAWFLAELDDPRAFKASDVAAELHQHGVHMISVSKNVSQAVARLRQMTQAGDEIVVFGSFVTVAAALNKLQKYADHSKISKI